MKILTNKEVRNFVLLIGGLFAFYIILVQAFIWFSYQEIIIWLFVCSILILAALIAICFRYFYRQNKAIMLYLNIGCLNRNLFPILLQTE